MDPEPGEVIFFHGHPAWRSMAWFYAKGLVASVAAGAIAGLISASGAGHVEVAWVVVAVLVMFVALLAVGHIRRMQTTYSITSRRLTIETGLFSRDLHQTRLGRIQNVNANQSLLHRLLGIGTVNFDTAAETDFDFSFYGVSDPRAIVRTVDQALQELDRELDAPADGGL